MLFWPVISKMTYLLMTQNSYKMTQNTLKSFKTYSLRKKRAKRAFAFFPYKRKIAYTLFIFIALFTKREDNTK